MSNHYDTQMRADKEWLWAEVQDLRVCMESLKVELKKAELDIKDLEDDIAAERQRFC
jgi:hypothetical protein